MISVFCFSLLLQYFVEKSFVVGAVLIADIRFCFSSRPEGQCSTMPAALLSALPQQQRQRQKQQGQGGGGGGGDKSRPRDSSIESLGFHFS